MSPQREFVAGSGFHQRVCQRPLRAATQAGQGGGFSRSCRTSYLEGNRVSRFTWKTTDGLSMPNRWPDTNLPPLQSLRPDKGRDYIERGEANPALTLIPSCLSRHTFPSSTLPSHSKGQRSSDPRPINSNEEIISCIINARRTMAEDAGRV